LLSTICIQIYISLFSVVTTPQPPYGGSHREANTGSDGLGALAATLYRRSYVLPDYGILLHVRTDLPTYDVHTYDVKTVTADRLDYYWATYCRTVYIVGSNSHSPLATIWETVTSLK
jgi:hypothetical protein